MRKYLLALVIVLTLAFAGVTQASSSATNYFMIKKSNGALCAPGWCQMVQITNTGSRVVGIGNGATFKSHVLVWWLSDAAEHWGNLWPFPYNGYISNQNFTGAITYYAQVTCSDRVHIAIGTTRSLSNEIGYAYRNLGLFTVPVC